MYARRLAHTRPQTLIGAVSQMCAALTHHVNEERLHWIQETIPRITLVTGDQDALVNPRGTKRIWEAMTLEPEVVYAEWETKPSERRVGNVELVRWEKTGHPIHIQWPKRFNALLEKVFAEGNAAAHSAVTA
jgi:hypothetical protein